MQRRDFLKRLGFTVAAAAPGAALLKTVGATEAPAVKRSTEEILARAAERAAVKPTDTMIPEMWARESLNTLMENQKISELVVRDFSPKLTDDGVNYVLDVAFKQGPPSIDDWHVGLIDAVGFTALCNDDTVENKGWQDAGFPCQPFVIDELPSFDIDRTGTVKGAYLFSPSSGVIFSQSLFDCDVAVVNGDRLTIDFKDLEDIINANL